MKFLNLTWHNLKRRKARTLLTLLSVLVAFLLFGLLAAIRAAFGAGVDLAGADRLVVRHKVSLIQLLPVSYGPRMEQVDGVALATHMTWFGGVYQDSKQPFGQFPCEPEKLLALYPELVLPEDQKKEWLQTRTGAIVGETLVKRFGFKIGDRVPIRTSIWPQPGEEFTWEFDIVGIYSGAEKGTDTTGMYFHYDYFDEARAFGQGLVGWYGIRVTDDDLTTQVAKEIDEEFANSAAETKSEAEKAFMQGFVKQIGDIGTIMVAILSAVFFTILLVTGNTMAQAVRERTEELGVLKALGFTNTGVLGLVLLESVLLAVLGGVAGLGLAYLVVSAGDPTGGYLPVFYIPRKDLVIGTVFILILGLVSGAFPAWQAMRLRIADALRR